MTGNLQYNPTSGTFTREEPKSQLEVERERNADLALELASMKAERDQWRAVAEVRGRTIAEYSQKLAAKMRSDWMQPASFKNATEVLTWLSESGVKLEPVDWDKIPDVAEELDGVSIKTKMYR